MFKSKSKSKGKGKGRVKPLLNLALQDSEWYVDTAKYLDIDHNDKIISFPVRPNDDYDGRLINRTGKLLAYVDAKYNKPRKYVGVKHLQPLYTKSAENLTVYWYANKKGLDKVGLGHRQIERLMALMPLPYERDIQNMIDNLIHSIYSDTLDPIHYIHAFTKMPLIVTGDMYYFTEMVKTRLKDIKGYETAKADERQLRDLFYEFAKILRVSFNNIMSTRKDSNAVSNNKIKEVAQYIFDECVRLSEQYSPRSMPSVLLDEIGDYEIDTQGVIDEKELSELDQFIKDQMRAADKGENAFWGKMGIKNHQLPRTLPADLLGKSKRKKDIGVKPNAMHRYATDKKIFIDKAKRVTGTLLIDASGSMDFDNDDIEEIVKLLPASTIAIYSGTNHPENFAKDDTVGYLHVIAKNGKWVKEIPDIEQFRNNIVDGPAIDWLAKQAEPRILVSDLQFTGVAFETSDGSRLRVGVSKSLFVDALGKMKKANVIPLYDIDKAKEWVKAYKNN